MDPTFSFNINGGPGVRVSVRQTDDGKLEFTAAINAGTLVGDLRALFFHVANPALLGGLSVIGASADVTAFQQVSDGVSNLGSGVSMLGVTRPLDVGIAFGTAALGAEDLRSVTFTLEHATEDLTLAFVHQMQFGVVMSSVGAAGGARSTTVRATGTAPANSAPTASGDSKVVPEDGSLDGSVAGLVTDAQGNALTFTLVGSAPEGLDFRPDGTYTYAPPADFDGATSFRFKASDGSLDSNVATVDIDVTPENDAPTAITLSNSAVEENSAAGTLVGLLGALDVDGGPAAFSIVGGPVPFAIDGNRLEVAGALDFETRSSYSVTVRADDGAGGTFEETFTIGIDDVAEGGGNTAPVATNDSRSVPEDGVFNGSVVGLVSDAQNDALTYTLVAPAPSGLVFNADGSYTYTPPSNFDGDIAFQYKASDGSLDSNTATVSIDVTPVNDAPVATGDSASTPEDQALVITAATLLANDSDVDGPALSIASVGNASHGSVGLSGGIVTFTPAADYSGPASFEYTVSDGAGGTDTATVNVSVAPVNDAPVATDDSASTPEDQALVITAATLLANDSDVDGPGLNIVAVGGALHGSVVLDAGTITFAPEPNYSGSASFEYTVSDGAGGTDTATVNVSVTPVNDAPTDITLSNASVPENSAAGTLVGLLGALDVDGGPAAFSIVGGPVPFAIDGNRLEVAAALDFETRSSYSVTVRADDGAGGTFEETFTIGIDDVAEGGGNTAPVATNDSRSVPEDGVFNGSVVGLVSDAQNDALTYTLVAPAPSGLVFNADGSYTYTPPSNFDGDIAFQYKASDGSLDSNTATVSIDVTPVNDAPVAVDDTASTDEDTALVIAPAPLLANDSDIDGPGLNVVAVGGALHGSVVLDAGTITFIPEPNYSGPASFSYTVSDGTASDTGRVDITVNAVNDAPVATDDSASTPEDQALVITAATLLANDSDVDGPGLNIVAVGGALHGSVVLDAGTITFTPEPNYSGSASFEYTVSDGAGGTDTATVNVSVTPVNDAPSDITLSNASVPENSAAGTLVGLLGALDVDGGPAVFSIVGGPVPFAIDGNRLEVVGALDFETRSSYSVTVRADDGAGGTFEETFTIGIDDLAEGGGNTAPVATNDSRSVPEDGVFNGSVVGLVSDAQNDALTYQLVGAPVAGLVFNADGSYTYTPPSNFDGDIAFQYKASDGSLDSNTATVSIDVTPVNDAPVATGDSASTPEDQALVITAATLLANDSDIDGAALSITSVGNASHGSVGLSGGIVTFTPAADYSGPASFEYTVSDGAGGTDTATVNVSVTPVNDAPVATGDSASTPEDQALVITAATLLANDSDIDGGPLSVTAVGNATHGTVGLSGGIVTFTPATDYSGPASFEYTVSDGAGGTDTATVNVSVTPVNDPPTDITLSNASVPENSAAGTLVGLLGALDVDGGPAAFSIVGGAVPFAIDGNRLEVAAALDFETRSSYSVTVRADDGAGGTFEETFTIGIDDVAEGGGNTAPVATNDSRSVPEDGVFNGSVVGLVSDAQNDALTYTLVAPAPSGLVFNADGSYTYTPPSNFDGDIAFQYKASDGSLDSNTATVSIDVTPVNDAPVAVDDTASTDEDTALVIAPATLLANDSDIDGPGLNVVAVGGALHGSVVLDAGTITFIPEPNYSGPASFSYTVSDGTASDTGRVDITVNAVNDAPSVVGESAAIDEDQTIEFTVASLMANDSDIDGGPLSITNVGGAVNGLVTRNGDIVSFTPLANFHGAASFTYNVSDGVGGNAIGTVSIAVAPVNDPPSVSAGLFQGTEDTDFVISVASLLGQVAADIDGDTLSLVSVSSPAGGTVTVASGNVVFSPVANFNGNGQFLLTVSDGLLQAVGQQTIAFADVNDAPVAADDVVTRTPSPQVIPYATLFGNDSDIDSPPAGWTVGSILNASGVAVGVDNGAGQLTVNYTPGHVGAYSFEYTLLDGEGGSAVARVTLNTAPDAQADAVTVLENAASAAPQFVDVVANDTDADGDARTLTQVSVQGGAPVTAGISGDNRLFFQITDPAFNGPFSIGYTISDGRGGTDTAQLSVTVTPQNDAPFDPQGSDAALALTVAEDGSMTVPMATLLGDDIDYENDPLSIAELLPSGDGSTVAIEGANVRFTPAPNFSGPSSFSYRAQDNQGGLGSFVHVPVNVTPVEDPPIANDDVFSRAATPTQTLTFSQLLANDTDADNTNANAADDDALTITQVSALSGGTAALVGQSVVFTFTSGVAQFQYTLSDGSTTDTALVTLNDTPVAVDDTFSAFENNLFFNSHFVNVVGNDTDPNGNALTLTGVSVLGGAPIVAQVWDARTIRLFSTQEDFNGVVDIDYSVTDGVSSDTGRLVLTVLPQDDAPRDTVAVPGWGSATDGIFNGTEDQPLVIQKADLLFDDQDPEGELVSWNSVVAYQSGSSVQDNGTSITFTPGLNREGTDYGFYYRVQDEANPDRQVSQAIFVVVNLAPVQDPIVAQNDVINRDGSDPQVVAATSMTFNDIDPDAGDTKNILSVAAGNGLSSVTLNADDSVSVDFAASYTGRATYTYTVEDSAHDQSTATVTLNRLPVATGEDLGTLDEGQNSIFVPWSQFLGNDVDPDGDPSLSVQIMGVDGNIFASSFFGGVQISVRNSTYTGPAQLQYRVSDGTGVSNTVTATMTWVEGNDAPVANTDYWFNNSTAGLSNDTRPAFNPMAGVEDQPMQFPASLLIGGQFLGATLVSGRDTDEDLPAETLSVDPNSLGSPYGTVTLIDVAGVPTIRFEPFQDVNSFDPFGGLDEFRPYIFYRTTDGLRSSATGFAYVHLAPQDDVPVANDDVFSVAGGSAWSLDIGDVFGTYDVRANDSSPDDYPYGFDTNATSIVSVAAVSGIDTINFDGFTVDIVGSGGPAVFSYTLRDSDGDESTAQVTLVERTLGPIAFYFSGNPDENFGNVDDSGRELWGFDPTTFSSLATRIDDAETSPGFDSGDPMEITPVSDGVFWRGSYNGSLTFDEFFPFGDYWSFYNPNLPFDGPFRFLGVEVGYGVFDGALDPTEQNLGIRAGHDFWGAGNIDGPTLTGWDSTGNEFATVFLAFDAHDRELLTDAGGVPAFAAYSDDGVFGEQLWAVLPDQQVGEGFFTWDDLRLTGVSNGPNVIREIAGLQAEENPDFNPSDVRSRVFYFAGDYHDDFEGEFRANALWRVISTYNGETGTWSTDMTPEWLDNGSSGIFDTHAHGLTVVTVPDNDEFQDERLFFFQDDDAGDGHIATIEVDVYGAEFSNSTGTKYFGDQAFTGREIRPWENGVVFSGQIEEGDDVGDDFVALYQDFSGGQGVYSLSYLYQSDSSQDVEQLVVSDQHQLAFVVDNGDVDELWYSDGFSLTFVNSVFGEITDVAFAGDQLAYVMLEHTNRGSFDRLHHYDPFGGEVPDRIVPTDATTYPFPGSGNFGINNNVNISGGMVFEGFNGFNSTRQIVNNGAVVDSGLLALSRGAAFQGDWLGVVDQGNGVYRLQLIDSTGSSSELPGQDIPGNDAVDAVWDSAVLGDQVLYGLTDDLFRSGTSTINQVRTYDAGAGTTTVLLPNHLLGRAETVGSEVIFNALDFGTGLWKLYSYDGAATTELTVMQSPNGTQQPVNPYTPGVDFLGHGNVLFWKQAIGFAGEEAVVFDRGVPGTTVLNMRPGTDSGGAWGDAVAANGRFYWQASTGPLTENMRLFTVVDEAGFTQEVTGPLLYDVDIGTGEDAYQFPYLPQVIGNRVYFMGNSVPAAQGGSGTWAVFEINTDGVPDPADDPTPDDATARMITPTTMGFVTGLSAIGSELYFGEGDQVWKMDPLVPGSLEQLTQFTDNGGIGQFFQGSDGNIYFNRDVPWTGVGGQLASDVGLGSELWMLDESAVGAHLVIDLNQQVIDAGYNPTQLVGVPDPLEWDDLVIPT